MNGNNFFSTRKVAFSRKNSAHIGYSINVCYNALEMRWKKDIRIYFEQLISPTRKSCYTAKIKIEPLGWAVEVRPDILNFEQRKSWKKKK